MSGDWIDQAQQSLLSQTGPHGTWGYRPGSKPCVESTALAGLALLAFGRPPREEFLDAARRAADWLVGMQQPNGSLGASEGIAGPSWGTAFGLLLWESLPGRQKARSAAVHWLLQLEGNTYKDESGVFGHDGTLVGWPWVPGTHSWLEPTAMALLALRREGMQEHPRFREAIRLVCDRAISTGGWNYGNTKVFGSTQHPQPATTGIALLALAGEDCNQGMIDRACRYLAQTLPRVRSPRSLGWGLLGLAAWDRHPRAGADWLSESFARWRCGEHAAAELSLLLLASGQYSLELIGTSHERRET